MAFFSSLIGDVPGEPQIVFSLADDIGKMHEVTSGQEGPLRSAPGMAPSWEGEAADAFETSHNAAARDLAHLSDGLEDGRSSVLRYGSALQAYKAKVAELKNSMAQIDATIDAAQGLDKIALYLQSLPKAKQIHSDYVSTVENCNESADICAAELRNALHLEATNIDGDRTNIGRLKDLTDDDITLINQQIENMDPSQVNQNGIGDCYFLASLASIMQTEEGREWLKSCIKPHYDANGKQDGYLVTIYDDPMNPDDRSAHTVLVTDIYEKGVKGQNGQPSVASIMEAAYGQQHPGGTRGSDQHGISEGSPEEGIEDLTGENAETTNRSGGIFGFGSGYDPFKRVQITEAIDQHKPVVAETASAPEENFPNGENHDSANVSVTLPGGRTETITIPRGHAYTVVDSDENGVTLRNPWGHNNLPSGETVDGGTFTMSWEDFGRYYGSVSTGDGYK